MLPIDPDIFHPDISRVTGALHRAQDPRVINRVLRKRRLQPPAPRAARVKMRRVFDQRLNHAVRHPNPGEVSVVQSERQSRHIFYQSFGGFWRGRDGADVRFNAENYPSFPRAVNAPGQLFTASPPGVRRLFLFKHDARQTRDMFRSASVCVIQRFQKPVTRLAPSRSLRMVDGERHKVGRHLEKDICATQTAVSQFTRQAVSGLGR